MSSSTILRITSKELGRGKMRLQSIKNLILFCIQNKVKDIEVGENGELKISFYEQHIPDSTRRAKSLNKKDNYLRTKFNSTYLSTDYLDHLSDKS